MGDANLTKRYTDAYTVYTRPELEHSLNETQVKVINNRWTQSGEVRQEAKLTHWRKEYYLSK